MENWFLTIFLQFSRVPEALCEFFAFYFFPCLVGGGRIFPAGMEFRRLGGGERDPPSRSPRVKVWWTGGSSTSLRVSPSPILKIPAHNRKIKRKKWSQNRKLRQQPPNSRKLDQNGFKINFPSRFLVKTIKNLQNFLIYKFLAQTRILLKASWFLLNFLKTFKKPRGTLKPYLNRCLKFKNLLKII